MTWTSFRLNVPQGLSTGLETLTTGFQGLQAGLETGRAAATALFTLFRSPTNPSSVAISAAVTAAVTAINTALSTLLNDTGVYLLVVPIPKRGLARLLPEAPNEEMGTNRVQFPTNRVPARTRASEIFQQITNPDTILLGGNAYFARTVSEALFDAGDVNRPRFTATDKWAYATVITGAADITTALSLAGAFDRIFRRDPNLPANRGAVSLVPDGFDGRLSTQGIRAVLTWEHVPAARALQSLDQTRLVTYELAIIRSADWRIRMITQVTDLFPTNVLTRGMRGSFGAEVVDVFRYDGIVSQWTDPTEIPAGQSRFYTVAFRTRSDPPITQSAQTGQDYGYTAFPNPVEIRRPASAATTRPHVSHPPDWSRSRSLLQTIPALGSAFDGILEELNTLQRSVQSVDNRIQSYLNLLQQQIDTYAARLSQFTEAVQNLAGLSQAVQTLAGASARLSSGQGPVDTFLGDFLEGFNPQNPNEVGESFPPFTSGLEYTCGVVILAVGPDVSGIQAFFEMLFGPPSENEVEQGVTSIEQAVAEADAAVIAQISGPAADPNLNAFTADMTATTGPDASCT